MAIDYPADVWYNVRMRRKIGVRFRGRRKRNYSGVTLRGEEGKTLRIVLICAAALIITLVTIFLNRPKDQLMSTAEMRRITDRGVLVVGVRNDIPGFALDGEGLEIELARSFADYLLPETETGAAAKLVVVSGQTAATKLSDGSIDVAIALMQKGASSKYSYSYPYYTDRCVVVTAPETEAKPLNEMLLGYVQNTAGANVLTSYIDEHETKVQRSFIDRLRGRTPELPEDAVVFNKQAFASYPDLLDALKNGVIDGAVLTGVYLERYGADYELKVHPTELGTVEYAITASADEPAIARLADVFIYELERSGKLDAMLDKYGLPH